MDRYIVTSPVRHGYSWWNVADTQSRLFKNFAVATFSESIPHAEQEARGLSARLNEAWKRHPDYKEPECS